MSLISAIPRNWKKILYHSKIKIELELETEFAIDKPSQFAYQQLNSTRKVLNNQLQMWQKKINVTLSIEDIILANDVKRLTQIAKYVSFQFR